MTCFVNTLVSVVQCGRDSAGVVMVPVRMASE